MPATEICFLNRTRPKRSVQFEHYSQMCSKVSNTRRMVAFNPGQNYIDLKKWTVVSISHGFHRQLWMNRRSMSLLRPDIYQLSRKHGTVTRLPSCKMRTDETLLHIFLVRRHVLDFLMLEKGTGEF